MISDACKQAITRSTIPPGQDLNPYAGEIICLKNGMLNLNTKQLLPHDRKYLSTIQVQASFDPAARCPRWMQFWEETLGDIQKIKILQEWTGYCLTKDTSHHKALFLVGPGQDGKSTYLKILEQLIGQDARSNVTLRELENEFHRVTLFGKLLNVSTETEFSEALTSDFFKAIVSGDGITAAHKNKPVFSFYPFCKLAFGMNRLPRARDYSFGFYRRLIIIRFTRQFLGPSEDKTLSSKLTAEIDGILNWALVGLDRLWDQGGFTESDDVKKILREYQIENNPVLAFIEEKCTLKERYGGRPPEIEKQQLFNMYKEFCVEHNFRPVGASYFFRQIKDLFPAVKDERRRDGSGRKIYLVGIGAAPIGAEDVGDGN
jgi:putative DNA primase/helicase